LVVFQRKLIKKKKGFKVERHNDEQYDDFLSKDKLFISDLVEILGMIKEDYGDIPIGVWNWEDDIVRTRLVRVQKYPVADYNQVVTIDAPLVVIS
jgi:hypothetical protein